MRKYVNIAKKDPRITQLKKNFNLVSNKLIGIIFVTLVIMEKFHDAVSFEHMTND